jgi:YidC/Oxa1 family membrane protein insertase
MFELWQGLLGGLAAILEFFHDLTVPIAGVFAWGWAIILLTLTVRVLLLPLAIKQTQSMRAMQALSPEVKKIQSKYKADRSLMRSDPEKFRELRGKQQEELTSLYRERGVNPAAGCLPLIAQMPVFFALFTVLRDSSIVPELAGARFYLIDPLSVSATQGAGIGAFLLIALMGVTTFVSQRQMMASNPAMANQPQQRIMLYAMPVLLTVFGINFPAGVLLYWVTTNLWTMGQQYVMFRRVGETAPGTAASATSQPTSKKDGVDTKKAVLEDSGATGQKPASAPKGAPTPKRSDARKKGTASSNGGKRRQKKKGKPQASGRQRRS